MEKLKLKRIKRHYIYIINPGLKKTQAKIESLISSPELITQTL